MYNFGLECEFFMTDGTPATGKLIVLPKNSRIPYDECGYLAEARGLPADNIINAVFNLRAEIYRIEQIARKEGINLLQQPLGIITKEMKNEVHRRFVKGVNKYENIYGHISHRNSQNQGIAGIHLSVTNINNITVGDKSTKYYGMWDWVKFFRYLDSSFKYEIKAAKRNPGFYEIKSDGRIEYRSLPNCIDLIRLINVVQDYFSR